METKNIRTYQMIEGLYAAQQHAADMFEQSHACEMVKSTPNRRVFACDQCDKTFKARSGLREHKRKHTGAMPYSCSHAGCNYQFKWRSSLANHRRYHKTGQLAQQERLRAARLASPIVDDVCSYESRSAPSSSEGIETHSAGLQIDEILGASYEANVVDTMMSSSFWENLDMLNGEASDEESEVSLGSPF